jgi:uncharacterized protein (TIGR00725 family)
MHNLDGVRSENAQAKVSFYVGVIGGSESSEEVCALAREVGREVARRGHVLVCGGLGGVMEAAARGAREEGGLTIGVLPTGSRADANPYIDVAIATDMGHARNAIIANTSDALIAVGGSYGTLSEISFGLKLGKKVVSLKSWDFDPSIVVVSRAAEAVAKATGG